MRFGIILSLFMSFCLLHAQETFLFSKKPLSEIRTMKELSLIEHVKQSIQNAEEGKSKINSKRILTMSGMSSQKVRHLLNNLCSFSQTCYLEIGVWKGSTWISALYGNQDQIHEAVAIDNWSQFNGPRRIFGKNVLRYLGENRYVIKNEDSFTIDTTRLFSHPVTCYFYDGHHSEESQRQAFTYYNSIFDDVFIAIAGHLQSRVKI
jgi:hypothetical protein